MLGVVLATSSPTQYWPREESIRFLGMTNKLPDVYNISEKIDVMSYARCCVHG